ncbi:MAG: response regulator [Actinobacteria bacterium]|nr:response regulator [Actinomycetota bacterium]
MEAKGRGYGKRILCIEDDPEVSTMLRTVLSMQGYEVVEASKGTVGLDLLYRTFPHAVLLDLRMPVLSGMGILDILREKGGLREVPVVCITAVIDAASMYEALYRGADAYLFKPIDIDLLRSALAFLLEERERPARAAQLAGHGRAGEILGLLGREVDQLPKLEALLFISSRGRVDRLEPARGLVYRGEDLERLLQEMVEAGILTVEGRELAVSGAWRERARRLALLVKEHRGLELAANLVHMGVNLLWPGDSAGKGG